MTRLTIVIFLLCLGSFTFSQECKSYNDYKSDGGNVANLDSLYPSAMHVDTTIAVFHGREDEFYSAWVTLLTDLGKHLKGNDFVWEKSTRCFNRVYFNREGRIDTFLFNFKEGEIDKDKQETFASLLSDFTKDYKLRIDSPAKSDFSQCGSSIYKDKE